MKEKKLTKHDLLQEQIVDLMKIMNDIEIVMGAHEKIMKSLQAEIKEIKRKQKNSYGVL